MVQYLKCGFCEPGQTWPSGICAENPKHPLRIADVSANIECEKFIERRRDWKLSDVHEWRDRYVNMKMTRNLAIISLCVSVLLGGTSLTYTYLSHQAQQASVRGNLSILNSHPIWDVTNSSCFFNVTGEIRNEGARAVDIINIEIIVEYPLKDSRVLDLHWENYTLLEKESRKFTLVTGIIFEAYPSYQLAQYPTKGSVVVTYNDGLGNQEQTKSYPFLTVE
jgi:hypothetical protein